jgi:hypothetical protein
MPEGVMYLYQGQMLTVYFSHPKAQLPLRRADGEIKLATWGRRKIQTGELPLGGWANLSSIYQGKWSLYMPKPIRLPIVKFMKKDFEGCTHWYDVTAGQWVQGLVAQEGEELRVYIVTITPESHTVCHDRWPRIMAG